jgi:glycerol uptake facilitator-like aquaporin
MFARPVLETSTTVRSGGHLWVGEIVATFGLVLVIFTLGRSGDRRSVPLAVAGYIAAAYWFTSSTSFANPAVTIARTLSDSYAASHRPPRRRAGHGSFRRVGTRVGDQSGCGRRDG